MYVCICVGATVCAHGDQDHQSESILSTHHVGPGDQTQVRLDGKCLYPLRHLSCPIKEFLFCSVFQNRVSLCSTVCPGTPSVDQAVLELLEILLPPPLECWD